MGLRELRPHQVRALDGLKDSIRAGRRRPMLQLPTGAGKTVVAAHIVTGARSKGNRVCFCVPSLGLIDQTFDRFVENGLDPAEMGVIQADHPWRRPHAPIQIATAQTLARRELPITDVVVVDEAHIRHKVYESWMTDDSMAKKPFIGLSATPWASGLGKLFDDLVKPVSMSELIEQGYLSKFRVFAPTHPDLSGVKMVAGDYHEGQLSDVMGKPKLVADTVSTWLERAEGRPTLCFAVDRAHAQKLHDEFAKAHVASAYVDAFTPREERQKIGERLAAGEIKVVCNIGTLTTGIDWDVRCISLCRPTKSEILYVQIIGRGLRPAEGKDHCLILDHSDTTLRLGMVDEIDHDELSIGKAPKSASEREKGGEDVALPKACEACGALVPPRSRECPACGHVARRPVKIETVDGDLSEIGRGGKRKGGRKVTATELLMEFGKTEVWGQLKAMQREYGWSDGRTAHSFKDLFGVWPNHVRHAAERTPSPQLRSWIRSRAIAYARSKAAQDAA